MSRILIRNGHIIDPANQVGSIQDLPHLRWENYSNWETR